MGRPHMGSEIVSLLHRHVFSRLSIWFGAPQTPNVNSVRSVGALTARIVTKAVAIAVGVIFDVVGNGCTIQLRGDRDLNAGCLINCAQGDCHISMQHIHIQSVYKVSILWLCLLHLQLQFWNKVCCSASGYLSFSYSMQRNILTKIIFYFSVTPVVEFFSCTRERFCSAKPHHSNIVADRFSHQKK